MPAKVLEAARETELTGTIGSCKAIAIFHRFFAGGTAACCSLAIQAPSHIHIAKADMRRLRSCTSIRHPLARLLAPNTVGAYLQ
jgi:hypothetical protein